MVHRDLKPSNVLIGDDGRLAITDFGIARETRHSAVSYTLQPQGQVLGTPLYMAPEQAEGRQDLDHRVDLYALGAILCEMLGGSAPFSSIGNSLRLPHGEDFP